MREHNITASDWFNGLCITVAGIGIGWLIGLSVSPVVSIVLTSVTGIVAAIVAALGGLNDRSSEADETEHKNSPRWRVNPLPLAMLIVGIIMGSILGLTVRNNHWLGSDISAEIIKWTDQGIPKEQIVYRVLDTHYPQTSFAIPDSQTLDVEVERWVALDLPKDKVVQRLFDRQFPSEITTKVASQNTGEHLGSILYAVSVEECNSLLASLARAQALNNDQEIVSALVSSSHIGFQRLPEIISNPTTLRQLVEEVLCIEA